MSAGAYSFTLQANLLADVLGGQVYVRPFRPPFPPDVLIIIGNIDIIPSMLPHYASSVRLIFYTVIEGDFPPNPIKTIVNRYRPYIVTPTKYVKSLLERYDIHVDAVIPHGIAYLPPPSIPSKDIDFLYVGEYQRRKLPEWGIQALKRVSDRLALVSSACSPVVRDIKPRILYNSAKTLPCFGYPTARDRDLVELYSRSKFYLNVSANEGFGLTPLEAEAFYGIPITPRLPALTEHLGDCPLWLDIDLNDYEIWHYGVLRLHLYHYDPDKLTELALNAKWTEERARECADNASRYYYKRVYHEFAKLTQEVIA